jgi:hypothetical protein
MGASAYRDISGSDCSWLIGIFGDNYGLASGGIYWTLYDGVGDGGFYGSQVVNSGLALNEGDTYNFSVTVDNLARNYTATITNASTGASYTTPTALGWRADAADYPSSMFDGRFMLGTRTDATGDFLDWSVDGFSVTKTNSTQLRQAGGFNGIWYYISNDPNGSDIERYKYSGGLGTYPQQIRPMAYYSETADKTFFVYGGSDSSNSTLYHCISYYDHQTGQVARPRILLDKETTDGHDNPSMMLDSNGYIYIFSSSHGNNRPFFVNRSTTPYSIDSFETVLELPAGDNNASYCQPLYVEGQGFFLFHTVYNSSGRTLCYNTSSDGVTWDYDWTSRPILSQMYGGQYQVSNVSGQTVGTAFNYLLNKVADNRTNLYYMQSTDFGQTWTTADGTLMTLPNTSSTGAALVHDYLSEGLRVYMKDLQYDAEGQPVIFYLTNQFDVDPDEAPHQFHIAHFDDGVWEIKDLFMTDHNYDYGQLTIEDNGTWRIIAPTIAGPQPYATGGEMAMWISEDEGDTWEMIRELTYDSDYNHTYAKQPLGADDEFYAFWADGDAYGPSESSFYFTDKNGTGVWKLPTEMTTDFATPELAYTPKYIGIPGDANQDGKVDASDATILAGNWQAWPATWEMGDFNGDGKVNASDATILAGNWQYDATATAVPEPGVWFLLLGLLCFRVACKKRR